ncbi:hypothetical protein AR158_c426L [Paramecium bursaria Chlorella virus AR158]|uniref:hypothetical protein n=1 Tax=Paramecium bursaria Chlorella virus AR158 TaxID=380598 RepID=UPI00015AA6D0|nr:hypothetical protein AR158_c426L [Paramecium bursaria Chlorella virus AR158]ABU43971.1 hypothetical protein AR158_c426L [Paramecium bursaria Chlorella virus AR158]
MIMCWSTNEDRRAVGSDISCLRRRSKKSRMRQISACTDFLKLFNKNINYCNGKARLYRKIDHHIRCNYSSDTSTFTRISCRTSIPKLPRIQEWDGIRPHVSRWRWTLNGVARWSMEIRRGWKSLYVWKREIR